MTVGAAIAMEAREWIGTPFVHCAQEKGVGCDCVGLFCGVARAIGLFEYRPAPYSRLVDPEFMRREVARFFDPIEDVPSAGDLVLLKVRDVPQHVAIATGQGTIIHAYEPGVAKVVENTYRGPFVLGTVQVYRLKEVYAKTWRRSS